MGIVATVPSNGSRVLTEYVDDFIDALFQGQVPAPSAGDCWYCCLRNEDRVPLGELTHDSHLREHVRERYYVPSLLVRAIEVRPVSPMARWVISDLWKGESIAPWTDLLPLVRRQLRSSLRGYLRKHGASK